MRDIELGVILTLIIAVCVLALHIAAFRAEKASNIVPAVYVDCGNWYTYRCKIA